MLMVVLVLAVVWALVATYLALRFRTALESHTRSSLYYRRTLELLKSREDWPKAHAEKLMDQSTECAFVCAEQWWHFDALAESHALLDGFYHAVGNRLV